MDHRDRLEEIFRERLHDWECKPEPDLWTGIAGQIPVRKTKLLKKSVRNMAAALALLLLVAGSLFHMQQGQQKNIFTLIPVNSSQLEEIPAFVHAEPSQQDSSATIRLRVPREKTSATIITARTHQRVIPVLLADNHAATLSSSPESATIIPLQRPIQKTSVRKWRIGMGGGNLSIAGISSGSNSTPDNYFNNDFNSGEGPWKPRSRSLNTRGWTDTESSSILEPTKVKHCYPFSIGLSLSRSLSRRWNFNTGLTYSCQISRWRFDYSRHDVRRQTLHFVGIPLSFSYRLTNWQRPYCYTSLGILGEVNVAGISRTAGHSRRIRIPGVLWSASARVGIAYPVVRFVSVYAEGGICYYFDYRGDIQTIRSKNAFNATGQIGIRLNF